MDFNNLDNLVIKLKSLRPLNKGELERLRNDFVVDNTYNSNSIEGSSLTLRETALILEGVTIAEKPVKEHLEAIGHKDAFDFMMDLAENNELLNERVIKDIHSLVLMTDRANRGVYRNVNVVINGASHTPSPPYLVQEQIIQLLQDYNLFSTRHIIESIAEFHLRFEGIHPFIDGNGRTGRILLNLGLIQSGLLPINIKYTDRLKYYKCFDDFYGNEKSIDTLVNLIVDYETEELNKYINMLK